MKGQVSEYEVITSETQFAKKNDGKKTGVACGYNRSAGEGVYACTSSLLRGLCVFCVPGAEMMRSPCSFLHGKKFDLTVSQFTWRFGTLLSVGIYQVLISESFRTWKDWLISSCTSLKTKINTAYFQVANLDSFNGDFEAQRTEDAHIVIPSPSLLL